MADWTALPSELVSLIGTKLPTVEDYKVLTAVCRSYRSATKNDKWCPTDASRAQWLLLSVLEDNKGGSDVKRPRGLLSMYRRGKKLYLNLPELHDRRCWGSAYGWIISVGLDRQLQLFNPLTRRIITLPKPKFDDDKWKEGEDFNSKWIRLIFFNKARLIKRPYSSNFDDFLVVTTGNVHGLFRVLKADRWEDVVRPIRSFVFDVICYKDQIYALCRFGELLVCSNFDGLDPPTASMMMPPDPRFSSAEKERFYAVELMGELVMVVRYLEYEGKVRGANFVGPSYSTTHFELFKLDAEAKNWVKIEGLGGCALFVGDGQSICLSRPEYFNCRRNCIYYTDDNYVHFGSSKRHRRYPFRCVGGYDMGTFDFEEGRNEPFYEGLDSLSTYSTPTWFIPSFS